MPPRRAWSSVALSAGILAVIYLLGLNRNLLLLSLLFSVMVMMAAVLRRRWAILLGLAICAFLAVVPAKVADLGKLYPAPRDIPGAAAIWYSGIGTGETWAYQFELGGLEKFSREGGANGFLYVDGRDLSGLVVGVQGKTLKASEFSSKKTGMDHVAIPIENVTGSSLTVTLRGMPPTAPRIFRGQEVHGHDVFGDAVWLEFTDGRNRAIYEAKRTVVTSGAR